MAFWGFEVKPGKPFTHTAEKGRLHISQATLGNGTAIKKSIVQCNVGNKSPVFLCTLFPEKAESCQLNLEFEEVDEVVFSVVGPRSVHLTGYYLGSGRHYNPDDESESYGEDIADTETERSYSDEDEYEDSFINDDDLEVFPPFPASSAGIQEEALDTKKAKNRKQSHRRLRKKYQQSESDNENVSGEKTIANANTAVEKLDSESEDMLREDILDTKKPRSGEGSRKGLRKKYQLSESDNENSSHQKFSGNSYTALEKLDSESEDMLPISSLCKVNLPSKNLTLTADENAERETYNVCDNRTKYNCGLPEQVDAVVGGQSERSGNLSNSKLPSAKVASENGAKPKKKRKKQSKEGKNLEVDGTDCCNVLKEDKAKQNGIGVAKSFQVLPVMNLDQVAANNNEENQLHDLLPPSQVCSEDSPKTKRKRKEQIEVSFPSQDLSINNERTQKEGNNKSIENDSDHLSGERKRKKKKSKNKDNMNAVNLEPVLSTDGTKKFVADIGVNNADDKSTQVKTFSSGLIIEELETGKPDGKIATLGKKVSIQYIGKLKKSGQVFDSNAGKSPLKFRLGGEKNLEGWDSGLDGMRVGGKRRLIIPPSMCYRNQGAADNIPPDSWLVFDVELIKVR